jgi:hypothetical protein
MIAPGNRFWATIAAQTGGVLLLFFMAIIFDVGSIFERERPCGEIEVGVQWIFIIASLVFAGLVVGFYRGFKHAHECNEFNDSCADRALMTFLYVDIPLLTTLVCLQGGLTRSMFSPLFGLILAAHYAVERRDKMRRVLWDVVAVVAGIVISFAMSILVARGMKSLWGVHIVDFSTLTPTRYALAILWVSLVSVFIFILQMQIIRMPGRPPGRDGVAEGVEQSVSVAPGEPRHEKEGGKEPKAATGSKRAHVAALLSAFVFVASATFLIGSASGVFRPASDTSTLITTITAIVSAISTISATVLAWRHDRRVARENKLKIEQLERELGLRREKRDSTDSEGEEDSTDSEEKRE